MEEHPTFHEGKPALRIAAVEISLHDLLDDRPKIPILPLETGLILGQELIEMMEEDPVEDGPLRMARAIDSRHIGKADSRNMPGVREEN